MRKPEGPVEGRVKYHPGFTSVDIPSIRGSVAAPAREEVVRRRIEEAFGQIAANPDKWTPLRHSLKNFYKWPFESGLHPGTCDMRVGFRYDSGENMVFIYIVGFRNADDDFDFYDRFRQRLRTER